MRLTCRATKAAVGAEITSVLRQVDRMMHSVGRRYYQRRLISDNYFCRSCCLTGECYRTLRGF